MALREMTVNLYTSNIDNSLRSLIGTADIPEFKQAPDAISIAGRFFVLHDEANLIYREGRVWYDIRSLMTVVPIDHERKPQAGKGG